MTAATERIATALAEIDSADKALDAARETLLDSLFLCGSEIRESRFRKADWEADAAYAALGLAVARAPARIKKAIALGLEGRDRQESALALSRKWAESTFCPVCGGEDLIQLSCEIPIGGEETDCNGCICDCQDCRELVRIPPEMMHRDWPGR